LHQTPITLVTDTLLHFQNEGGSKTSGVENGVNRSHAGNIANDSGETLGALDDTGLAADQLQLQCIFYYDLSETEDCDHRSAVPQNAKIRR